MAQRANIAGAGLDFDPEIQHHAAMTTLKNIVADCLACLRFYTRLPVRIPAIVQCDHEFTCFTRSLWAAPLAGASIGALGGVVLAFCALARLPDSVSAGLALTAIVLLTGALHEDGLADTADGLGGGASRERKLEIMRDSRLGAYGAIAVGLSLLLRFAAISALLERGVWCAVTGTIAAGAFSRAIGLLPLVLLKSARSDGVSASVGQLPRSLFLCAMVLGVAFGLTPLLAGNSLWPTLAAMPLAGLSSLAITKCAGRQIDGHTGDILGAAQQVAEILAFCALSAKI